MISSEPSELRTETTTTERRNGATSSATTPLVNPVKSDDQQHHPSSKNALMKLKSYLIALRVWSLSASIIPTILGKLPTCHIVSVFNLCIYVHLCVNSVNRRMQIECDTSLSINKKN